MILSDMDVGPCLLDIVLPFRLTSGNSGQGWSFRKSDGERKKFRNYFEQNNCNRIPFGYPTFVVITRVLGAGEKYFDYPNISRGNAKQIIDAMVAEGHFWHDDGPEYITGIYFRQDNRTRESGPAVRVQIWQSGDNPVRVKSPRKTGTTSGSKRPKKKSVYRRRGGKKR